MSDFPRLRTGAVAQYPATRSSAYSTQVFRFLDGGEQRYREWGAPLRRWVVRLDLLDEEELARIREFFEAQQGSFGTFAFEDPWDGVVYPDCSLESDELALEFLGESRGRTLLLIRENRS